MLMNYFDDSYDLSKSIVIGDRITDVQLAKNLGSIAILLNETNVPENLEETIGLTCTHWDEIYQYLRLPERKVQHIRNTNETKIQIELNLDGKGLANNHTGIAFFDHMLDQIAKHGNLDLAIKVDGDLHIDEHHTIEDTGIALGEAFLTAIGNKKGIQRYGFLLPMDDCLAQVAIDFSGRNWLVWDATIKREKIGDMPHGMQNPRYHKCRELEQRLAACRDALEEIQRINNEFNCDAYISEQCKETLALTAPK
jgi:imidazoleglycerol-phosphate dehydratase/histidinol-phosphatase